MPGSRSARPANDLDRALRSTVGREATTFGFSILVTVGFGVVQLHHGAPDTVDLLLYATGAVASFSLLTGLLTRGFRRGLPQHESEVVAIGTALNILSVLAGVGAAMGLAALLRTDVAWLVCPFVAGLVYLALESLEELLGERLLLRAGDAEADEVSD
jgi:hypothetical protein